MQLAENEVKGLCLKARDIFLSQPILLELEAPLKICGKFSLQGSKGGLLGQESGGRRKRDEWNSEGEGSCRGCVWHGMGYT